MKQDMSTTYGIKKQVTRLMAGSSHTLSLLMSMLRVSLEAAWSMARVWLKPRVAISLLLMLTLGNSSVWGQDYSGVYYIASVNYNAGTTADNYYLCPTEGWCYYQATDDFTGTDNGQPFLTTYQCRAQYVTKWPCLSDTRESCCREII